MLACDPNAPVDLQAKVVDARPNGRFAQNNAMQRARDDVRRLGWSLCREPLIATVLPAKSRSQSMYVRAFRYLVSSAA